MSVSDADFAALRTRFEGQLRRREIQINNQVATINRLLSTGGSYSTEMKELQEALSEAHRKLELITQASYEYERADGAHEDKAAASVVLYRGVKAALNSNTLEG